MRRPSPKKRGSKIGFIIDPFRRRNIWYESGLEENYAYVLVAMPRVAEVREQQVVVFSRQGRVRRHIFDFIVRWTDGCLTAYAVKYAQDIAEDLLADLGAIRDSVGDSVANEYSTLSETDIDRITIENAKLIVVSASDFDFAGQHTVRTVLRSMGREVRLGEIANSTGLGERGYRAALSLFQSGDLVSKPGELLDPALSVVNALHGI